MANTSSKRSHVASSLVSFELAKQTDPGLTSFAGLPLLIETWHALGLPKVVERELRLKKYRRGPTEAEWAEVLTLLPLAGGKTLEDIAVLKEDSGLARLWPVLAKLSPRSALDFLERFHDPNQPGSTAGHAVIRDETPALQALAKVNRHLVHEVARRATLAEATIDVDASVHECRKRTALPCYEGPRAYQPVIAVWAELDLIVADQFRDGNVPAGMGNLPFVRTAIENLPSQITVRRVRGDSALYEQNLLAYLDDNQIEFGISADMSRELRAAIEELPKSAWQVFRDRDGVVREDGRFWAEVPFVPEDRRPKGSRPFRYLAIRLPQQKELFDDPPTKFVALVSNRESMNGNELINWHREKCGTVEYEHDLLKNDLAARVFPSGKYGVNAAWYRFNILAHNLKVACARVALDGPEWVRMRPSTFNFRWVRRAGRVISHARTLFLVLSSMSAGMIPLYEAARAKLVQLVST